VPVYLGHPASDCQTAGWPDRSGPLTQATLNPAPAVPLLGR
jgi:hypothetical protein